jgi:hypothetical protein
VEDAAIGTGVTFPGRAAHSAIEVNEYNRVLRRSRTGIRGTKDD